MFIMIEQNSYNDFQDDLREIKELRHRVFVERLSWVGSVGGQEEDQYDALNPTYIAYRDPVLGMVACVRMLPTVGKYMLKNTFPQLLSGVAPISDERVYESSRFCVDTARLLEARPELVAKITSGLFLAMVEFGLARGCAGIVTVTDLRVERLVRIAGWPAVRIGSPQRIGDTDAVAVLGDVSTDALGKMRARAKDQRVKLFQPIIVAAQ
jgi:acyl homoserine lactone synthase